MSADTHARETKQAACSWKPGRLVTWVKSDWFCCLCGARDVWQEVDAGEDYYLGYSADCAACGHRMHSMERVP